MEDREEMRLMKQLTWRTRAEIVSIIDTCTAELAELLCSAF